MKMGASPRAMDKKPWVNNNQDYQIERLHIYGDEHPETNLRNKVIGYQFKESIDVMDPITKETHKEPVKQFMVNQLKLNIERERLIMSPFDEVLHKQLIDYEVDHISANGMPVYTSKNEHFVDALGLAHLAFVLKFPDITAAIKTVKYSTKITQMHGDAIHRRENAILRDISNPINPWKKRPMPKQIGKGPDELPGDYQKWVKVPIGSGSHSSRTNRFWGKRSGGFTGRSMW